MPTNQQGSNVNTSPSSFNLGAVRNGLGAAAGVYGAGSSVASGNYGYGALQGANVIPYFSQQFPQTFDPSTYRNPTSQRLINGVNIAGVYAQPGMDAYNFYGNVQGGNYAGAIGNAQGLTAFGQQGGYIPDSNAFVQGHTGLRPAQYNGPNNKPITGYAPYVNAPISGYQAIRDFKEGNYIGAGVNAAQSGTSAANIYRTYFPSSTGTSAAAGGAKAGADAASGGSSALSTAGKYAGYAGAAYAAYQGGKTLFDNSIDPETRAREVRQQGENAAAAYATVGLSSLAQAVDQKFLGGAGEKIRDKIDKFNPISILQDKLGGKIIKAFGGGVDEYKETRKRYRDVAKEQGILDENGALTLADGSKFDLNAAVDNTKFEDIKDKEGAGEAVAISDAIVSGLGLKGKQRAALSTVFAKAALSSGDATENLRDIAKKHGLDGDTIQDELDKQLKDKKIKRNEYDVWSSKAKDVFGGRGASSSEIVGDLPSDKKPNSYEDYAREHGIKPGQSFKVPGNPNRITVDEDGKVTTTLIGFDQSKVDFSKPPEVDKEVKGPSSFTFSKDKPKVATSSSSGSFDMSTAYKAISKNATNVSAQTKDKIRLNIFSGKDPSQGLSRDDIRQVFSSTAIQKSGES